MAITVTGQAMRGTRTCHTAAAIDGGWLVTWLPGRVLTRSQATTAMMLAEHADRCAGWPHARGWAAELGLTLAAAIAMASAGGGPPAA